MKLKLLTLGLFGIFLSCENAEEQYQKLAGKWKGADWVVSGQSKAKSTSNVSFQFNSDKTYQSQLGSKKQKGTYKLKNEHLYTQAEGEQEILVKIVRLTADSLVFDMNSGGQRETLVLLKEK